MVDRQPYYGPALSRIHHLGFGAHAERCAPGILRLLEPVAIAGGTVLELGCGSGALTARLVDAGHRVIATDASPAMVELAREAVPGAAEIRVLTLPTDPLPEVDAIVSVGHVLNYLHGRAAIEQAVAQCADVLRPGGVLAFDLLDRQYGVARADAAPVATVRDDWAVFVTYAQPDPETFVRHITSFVPVGGHWERDDEVHRNTLVEAGAVVGLLRRRGVDAQVAPGFGAESHEPGLVAVTGRRSD